MLSLVTFSYPEGGDSSPATSQIDQDIIDKLRSIDGFFTENAGQVSNEQVRFYSSGGMQAGFAESAVLLKLVEQDHTRPLDIFDERMRGPQVRPDDAPSVRGVMVRITFPGSNKVTPQGVQEMPHRSNYFIGNDPSKWRTGVHSYQEIVYRNLYDGIDLSYRMRDRQLKYEFIVGPGADPALIAVTYVGVDSLRIDQFGELIVSTALGEMRDGKPIAYQDERDVGCTFIKRAPLSFGFVCEDRDPSRPLVIDPLVYSTFLGGSLDDWARDLAVDPSGNVYLTGHTASVDFPTTPGAFNTTLSNVDAFVAKVDASGGSLIYSTLIGGTGRAEDISWSIALDPDGNAYIAGFTSSDDFPTTPGAFDVTHGGGDCYGRPCNDAFVLKLNPSGSALVYSTFLGGNQGDFAHAIVIDSNLDAYIVGATQSPDFPTTPGAVDADIERVDAFVTRLDASGSSLVYSTLLKGSEDDQAAGVAVDSTGSAFVTGRTFSTDFSVTADAFDPSNNGGPDDAFVTVLNPGGTALEYSTFLGGSGNDFGSSIGMDAAGRVHVAGSTSSADFPVTPSAYDPTYNGDLDAFVSTFDPGLGSLSWSTYLGGSGQEYLYGMAVLSNGTVFVTGQTMSVDFPVTPGAFDTTFNGGILDAYFSVWDFGGALVQSSFLGGTSWDVGESIAVDSSGSVYVTGTTYSADFPVTPGSFDTAHDSVDGFVVKLNITNLPPVAEAGPDKNAKVGEVITFDGSLSYDPDSSGFWSEMAPMPTARRGAGVASYVGKVYAVGGAQPGGLYGWIPLPTNEVYDVANDSWSTAAPMPTPRDFPGAATFGDRIYVMGGWKDLHLVDVNEEYDPATDTWTTKAPMPYAVTLHGLAVADDRIYAVAAGATYEYNPASDTWRTLSSRRCNIVTGLGNKVYCIGAEPSGFRFSPLAYVYDPPTDVWSRLPNMTLGRIEAAAVGLAGRLFVVGGETENGNHEVTGANEMYDPGAGTWTNMTPMPTPRDEMSIAAVADAFYVIGGASESWDPIFDKNERFSFGLSFDWDFGDGSAHSHQAITTHSYSAPGVYTVTLRVTDSEGAFGTDTLTVTITNANQPPLADAGGPYIGFEGVAVDFDGSSSSDPDGDSLQFRWDFESDGVWDTPWSASPFADHTWGDDYVGKVTVEVSDGNLTDTDTVDVAVGNVLPSGTLGIVSSAQHEGTTIQFSAHVTDPGSDDLFFRWSWGDGTPDEYSTYYNNGASPDPYPSPDIHPRDITDVKSHTYGDNGAFVVTVLVRDDDSGNQGVTLQITATPDNLPPSVTITGGMNIDEGRSVALTATATDPGSDDLTFDWEWGEGSSESRIYYNNGISPDPPQSPDGTWPFTAMDPATHLYGDNGLYSISLKVTDDDGGFTTWSGQLTVNNLPPSIKPFGPFSVNEGSPLSVTTSATDPGSDDLTFAWTFELGPTFQTTYYNDGVGPDPPQSPWGTYPFTATDTATHTYGDNAVYTLILTVTDDDGGVATYKTDITVLNLPPSIEPFGPFTVDEGSALTVAANATDPGSDDLTFLWSFELGPTVQNVHYNDGVGPDPEKSPWGIFPFTALDSTTHTYGDNAVYNLTLTVADDDGGSVTYETNITVNNLPPVIKPFGPFEVNEADPLSVTANATDPGSDDLTFTWTFEYGPATQSVHYNDGIWPDPKKSPWGTSPFSAEDMAAHTYGDNGVFKISLKVEDDDGGVATYETCVTVLNVLPEILNAEAFMIVNITLRVAGEKWHDVVLRLYEEGNETGYVKVVRYPGSPDDQSATLYNVHISLSRKFSAVAYYTPDDDPVNGQTNGADPAWLIIGWENGNETTLHHTFNIMHNDTWTWTVDGFDAYAVNRIVHLRGTAHDVGSDDLTFVWTSGYGRTFSTIYYNNGVSPDPYPSPDVNPITATNEVTLVYSVAGTYTITLTVTDDDGGSVTTCFDLKIG